MKRVRTPPWWAGLAAAEAAVACEGSEHSLRWEDGRLRLLDHPDHDAEQVLAALGGASLPCVWLAKAWARHSTSVELVTLGRRPGEVDLGLDPAVHRPRATTEGEAVRSMTVAGPLPPHVLRSARDLVVRGAEIQALLALPGPMIDRLVLTVMAACAERWDDEDFRTEHGLRIGAALAGRALPALRRLGTRVGDGVIDVGVSPARPGHGPTIAARIEPGEPVVVSAELPVAWLSEVWGRGVSEPDGAFVLAVTGGEPADLRVEVGEWTRSGPMSWEIVSEPARLVTEADGSRRIVRTQAGTAGAAS